MAAALSPAYARLDAQLAAIKSLRATRQLDAASQALQSLVAAYPRSGRVQEELAHVHRALGQPAAALSAYRRAVASNDALLEKLKSNMQEVRARGGVLYVLADADSKIESEEGINVIRMPEHYGPLSPLLHVVPLQLLSYHTAVARGTGVDKPRHLAKSVTVE